MPWVVVEEHKVCKSSLNKNISQSEVRIIVKGYVYVYDQLLIKNLNSLQGQLTKPIIVVKNFLLLPAIKVFNCLLLT